MEEQVVSEGTAQGTSAETQSAAQPSVDINQAREILTKLDPKSAAEILNSNKQFATEVTKTIRTTDIERRARELAANLSNNEISTLRTQLTVLQQRDAERAAREEESLKATMTDTEWANYKQKQELDALKADRDRLAGHVNLIQERTAKQKYIDNLAELGLSANEDREALDKASNPEEFLLTAVDRAMAKVKAKEQELETFSARLAALERTMTGGTTLAASSQGSAGGDMSFKDLQKAFVQNMDDPDIKKRYYAEVRARR